MVVRVILTSIVILCSLILIAMGLYNHESLGYLSGWVVVFVSNLQLLGYQLSEL